eukprot:Nitzschia sp. Nitz4//scaffold4_size323378//152217//154884//NITZ4_000661-RA/size323378-snap-gene-0.455-mRNA-1//-1//CDS//3329553402//2604//frame0
MSQQDVSTTEPNGSGTTLRATHKRKRPNPFRVRQGCIVALRYRPGGNDIVPVSFDGTPAHSLDVDTQTQTLYDVWVDPTPARDEGLALVGSRIRCCFPKIVLSESFEQRAKTRYIEGIVLSLVDYEGNMKERQRYRRQRRKHGTEVELLVDAKMLERMPFLKRVDKDVELSTLEPVARRQQMNELRMKGHGKAIVKIVLADIGNAPSERTKTQRLETKWVIRKSIVLKREKRRKKQANNGTSTAGETSGSGFNGGENNDPGEGFIQKKRPRISTASRYVGDGNDSAAQQEANWRWLSGFCDLDVGSDQYSGLKQVPNFIGEVMQLKATGSTEKTMAYAVVKRLLLPEHTKNGRLPSQHLREVFVESSVNENDDSQALSATPKVVPSFFRVPVEELIVISRNVDRSGTVGAEDEGSTTRKDSLISSQTYAAAIDLFWYNENKEGSESKTLCMRCRAFSQSADDASKVGCPHDLCLACSSVLQIQHPHDANLKVGRLCDCRECGIRKQQRQEDLFAKSADAAANSRQARSIAIGEPALAFSVSTAVVGKMRRVAFGLVGVEKSVKRASSNAKENTRVKPRVPTLKKRSVLPSPLAQEIPLPEAKQPTEESFLPTSCRLLPYNAAARCFESIDGSKVNVGSTSTNLVSSEKVRNMRQVQSLQVATLEEERDNTRAARANQRRLLRGAASIGFTVCTLSGKEHLLRFGRSSIHAWGVFADDDIKEGDLLVEYRGEIIGNAIAESREVEYEKAKIGSDYMFRIDANIVCDATKQGNVARFLNHSCDGNCFTKVISVDGTKRIVIYAKRDIRSGEELCYDYKFPLEYDESKRIRCHCGSKECRGFMNWDKRYTTIVPAKAMDTKSSLKSKTA